MKIDYRIVEMRMARTRLLRWFVWRLPHSVVYWCAIRVWAYATTGQYGSTDVNGLTISEAIKRWEER